MLKENLGVQFIFLANVEFFLILQWFGYSVEYGSIASIPV